MLGSGPISGYGKAAPNDTQFPIRFLSVTIGSQRGRGIVGDKGAYYVRTCHVTGSPLPPDTVARGPKDQPLLLPGSVRTCLHRHVAVHKIEV